MITLQQFKNKYLGKQVEYHSYGGAASHFQCVDLTNQYVTEVLDLTPIIGTDAKDFPTKFDAEDLLWIKNTPTGIPQEGDLVIWGKPIGKYTQDGKIKYAGHVAIFLSGDANKFSSLDQNWSIKQRVTLESHNYTNVSGWLRPKAVIPPMDNELQECLRIHTELVDQIEKDLKPKIADLEQTVDGQEGTIKAFEQFRNELSGKLACENQTTAILGTVERLLTVESQLDHANAENKILKEQIEGMGSADTRVQELTEANLELTRTNTALMEEVELLKKSSKIDNLSTGELLQIVINRLFRKS